MHKNFSTGLPCNCKFTKHLEQGSPDNEHYGSAPQIIESAPAHDLEELEGRSSESMLFRRPFIYHQPSHTVYIGEPGQYHSELEEHLPSFYEHGRQGYFYGAETRHPEETEVSWYAPHGPREVLDAISQHTGVPANHQDTWAFGAIIESPYVSELKKLADSWDTRQFSDPMSLDPGHGETSLKDCTCQDEHKLDCPVHGLNATGDEQTWSLPESNPVGLPHAVPRTWQQAYGAWSVDQMPIGWPWPVGSAVQSIITGGMGTVRDVDEPNMKAYVEWKGSGGWTNASSLTLLSGRLAAMKINPPHYNTWTGKMCHCPWGYKKKPKKRLGKLAGKKLDNLIGRPDLQSEEGKTFLAHLMDKYPEYEDIYHWLTNRWKKGDLRLYTENPDAPEHAALEWWKARQSPAEFRKSLEPELASGAWTPDQAKQYEEHHFTPIYDDHIKGWHDWFQAKRHPSRRGIDIMHPDFSPYQMENKRKEHQKMLEEERQLQEAMRHGKTEMVFPAAERDSIDWDEAYHNKPHLTDHLERAQAIDEERKAYPHAAIGTTADHELLAQIQRDHPAPSRKAGWHVKHLTAGLNDQEEPNDVHEALAAEGNMMNHCIGSGEQPYQRLAEKGLIEAYSLRDQKGVPHATWTYNSDGSLAELYGHSDKAVIPEYQKMINEWGKHTGYETNPDYQVGNHERLGLEEVRLPAAENVEDYTYSHHPETEWEAANDWGGEDGIDEDTSIHHEPPNWHSIASDYVENPPQGTDLAHFGQALSYNPQHENEFNEAYQRQLAEQPKTPEWEEPGLPPHPLHPGQQPLWNRPFDYAGDAPQDTPRFEAKVAHMDNWVPGYPGKWGIDKAGEMWTWNTKNEAPHHWEMINPWDLDASGQITPGGELMADDQKSKLVAPQVAELHPALRFDPEAAETWDFERP